MGGVQIGPLGPRGRSPIDYYANCGLESIGPGQIAVAGIRHYTTFEGLIDILLTRVEFHQVIVNHGDPEQGLLVPFSKESPVHATALAIGDLSGLADRAQSGPLDPNNAVTKVMLDGAAKDMRVGRDVVLRIVNKLRELRKKAFVVHFRACNMDDPVLVEEYKRAFGAKMVTYHPVRVLFLPINPSRMQPGYTIDQYRQVTNLPWDRARVFDDPIGLLWPLLIDVVDLDGHTKVASNSYIDQPTPDQIRGWAEFLIRQWREGAPRGFVLPVMWDDKELTYHCPLEPGFALKLRRV
jgi:hypothetical protein